MEKEKFTLPGAKENEIDERDIPIGSNLEEEMLDKFSERELNTEKEFMVAITEVYDEICGEHGRKEFMEIVLPQIKKIYRSNYRSAGMRALEIINKAADNRPEEIANYLKKAISKDEIEFSEISPEEHLREVIDAFNETVLEMADFCRSEYQGIIGGIIYGSYGKRVPNYESDLDIVFISKSDESDLYVENKEKFIRYLPDFRDKLQKKTSTAVDIWHGSYTLDNLESHIIGDNQPAIFEGYEVVSPYPEVKKLIEAKMAEIKKRQTDRGKNI